MSIYIYCPSVSHGALDLAQALGATRLKKFDGIDFWFSQTRLELTENDVVVCWGASAPDLDGPRVLNALANPVNKMNEIYVIQNHNIPTVSIYPAGVDSNHYLGTMLPRKFSRVDGSDLLNPPERADYNVLRESFIEEYRAHVFSGKIIKVGKKVQRDGFALVKSPKSWEPNNMMAHPWIRAYQAGWRTSYDEPLNASPKMKTISTGAIRALGLEFGAVDIGETSTGVLKIMGVCRRPILTTPTLESYTKAIKRWIARRDDDDA